jgi:hypothetical protein
MSIQTLSFFQQDQNYWNQSQSFAAQDQNYWSQAQAQSQASAADASLINVMGQAETNEAKGLASIANQTALNRVNSQISALVQQALQGSSGDSASSAAGGSSASSASSGSSSAAASTGAPATGIGTAPLTTGTSLSSLGVLPGGTITVGAGGNTTKYTSTGTDTVGDLINAINVDLPTNANATASLNSTGRLVLTGRNDTDTITVLGSGNDAAAIGFAVGNNTFEPTAPSASPASVSSSSGSANSPTNAASSGTSSASTTLPSYLALAEQGVTTAAGILSANGVGGTLVDLLA